MTLCGAMEHARLDAQQYAWQHAHGAATLQTYHREQEWHARGPQAIDAQMERNVTRWLAAKLHAAATQPIVPRVRPHPRRWKYTDAALIAAWIAAAEPRTAETMATVLGLSRATLYRVLGQHQMPMARLRALTAGTAAA